MNHPMAPAATATIVPARKALTMKCSAKSCWRSQRRSSRGPVGRCSRDPESGDHGCVACRSVWCAGASGWPTTTRRPSEVSSTSIGVPYRAVRVGEVITSDGVPETAPPRAM